MPKTIGRERTPWLKPAWAASFGLRGTVKDESGEYYIEGKLGQLYMYDADNVAAMFLPDEPQKGWKQRKDKLVEVGATVIQNGDMEGTVLIPFKDKKTVKLAAKLLGVKTKRTMSPEQAEALKERLAKARAAKTDPQVNNLVEKPTEEARVVPAKASKATRTTRRTA